jgi:hypothetical protein
MESSGWEPDVDFLFLAVKLMVCSVLRNGGENGWESFGWELDVDFLFLADKLMICCVENWQGEWMGVLWLGAGCGFSLSGS